MTKEKFKVDLYIRVSTDRQAKEGDSLIEQETELKKFCEFRKFEVRNILIERGKSGGNTNRPEYQRLLKDVSSKKINAVIVKKIDRLSRSLLDFEAFMKLLQENEVEFISLKESFDTTSAMGKAMLRVALVFAQLEREQTSERLIDVLDYRASQGQYNGGAPPYGYTNVNKELVPYPKERLCIEVMFNQFLENKSTTQTACFLNETGYRIRNGKSWDKRRIHETLKNPVYIGKMRWKNQVYQGLHQPIISEKKFNQIQEIFNRNHYIRGRSKTNAVLQKLIFCGSCGSHMTPTHGINRKKIKYYYYRCMSFQDKKNKCQVKYVSFKELEDRVIKLLLNLSEEEAFCIVESKLLKHNQSITDEANKIQKEIDVLDAKKEAIKNKRDHYLDSLITTRFSSAEREKINKRIDEMQLEEKQIDSQLFKTQFEFHKINDEKISIGQLKMRFISFKTDFETFSNKDLKQYLFSTLEKILYYPDRLGLKFKGMDWINHFKN